MLVLVALWGFNNVAIKLAAPGMSPVMQMGVRFTIAAVLLLLWARWRNISLFSRDGSAVGGLLAGALFAAEFAAIAIGLNYTSAARMAVFVNLAPLWTLLGLAVFVKAERPTSMQWLGVIVGFAGVAFALSEGFGISDRATLMGDALGVLASLLWGFTTVVIRASQLAHAPAAKTLMYQLGVAAPVLLIASPLMNEPGVIALTALTIASIAYQSVIVAFCSFLMWFWMLTRYSAGGLAVFTFLTPLVGVAAGAIVLGDPISARLFWGMAAVALGIALVVNRRA